MPKNEKGEVTCLNHPGHVLTNQTFVQFPLITLLEGDVFHSKDGLPARIKFCDICGYMEMYTVKSAEDLLIPQKLDPAAPQ